MEKNIKQWKMDMAVVEHSIHDKTEPHLNNIANWVFIWSILVFNSEADLFFEWVTQSCMNIPRKTHNSQTAEI